LPSSWFAIWPWGEETQIGEEMLIGRETSPEWLRRRLNQLGLDNVSRQHARITVQDSAAFVTDLGSSNGTFLNGEPMVAQAETPITGDGELRFGASLRVTLSRRSKG
jgi:pSer/pThr/pTyr-binding forkhead associated (FHA) protein